MSYNLFKAELKNKVFVQHKDKNKFAQAFATAYNNLVLRHFDSLSGGGTFSTISTGLPTLIQGIQSMQTLNYTAKSAINFFKQISPYIYAYWLGQTAIGITGVTVITNTGNFQGPNIPQNSDGDIFMDILIGCIAAHLLTISGTYTNFYPSFTVPWSGSLLLTTP